MSHLIIVYVEHTIQGDVCESSIVSVYLSITFRVFLSSSCNYCSCVELFIVLGHLWRHRPFIWQQFSFILFLSFHLVSFPSYLHTILIDIVTKVQFHRKRFTHRFVVTCPLIRRTIFKLSQIRGKNVRFSIPHPLITASL